MHSVRSKCFDNLNKVILNAKFWNHNAIASCTTLSNFFLKLRLWKRSHWYCRCFSKCSEDLFQLLPGPQPVWSAHWWCWYQSGLLLAWLFWGGLLGWWLCSCGTIYCFFCLEWVWLMIASIFWVIVFPDSLVQSINSLYYFILILFWWFSWDVANARWLSSLQMTLFSYLGLFPHNW